MAGTWFIGNDMVEHVQASYKDDAGATVYFDNTATVTYAVTDAGGNPLTIGGVPVTGSYTLATGSTTGQFVTTIESTVTGVLAEGAKYLLVITAAQGVNDGKVYEERRALRRA